MNLGTGKYFSIPKVLTGSGTNEASISTDIRAITPDKADGA